MEIGAVGNSGTLKIGPHLDYRIKRKGKFIDPERALSGQGEPVMLANNTLVGPGDVVSDAFGVATPNNNVEAAAQMAMPTAEVDPNSSGDWMLGDYAAIFNELASPADRMKMQRILDQKLAQQQKDQQTAYIQSTYNRLLEYAKSEELSLEGQNSLFNAAIASIPDQELRSKLKTMWDKDYQIGTDARDALDADIIFNFEKSAKQEGSELNYSQTAPTG